MGGIFELLYKFLSVRICIGNSCILYCGIFKEVDKKKVCLHNLFCVCYWEFCMDVIGFNEI